MTKAADKALAESMGRRRPREAIQAEVADSILAEIVPPSTVEVSIDSLYRSPYQVRTMGNEDDIAKLAESIQSSGMISPIVVRAVSNPQKDLQVKSIPEFLTAEKDLHSKSFEIITGHHRVLAAIRLGWSVIPAVIKHMTDAQAAIALTADNAIKKDLTDWDRYLSILMLEQTGACKTGREIAATLGVSPAQISNIRSFGKLPPAAQEAIKMAPATVGYKLSYEIENLDLNSQHPDLVVEGIQRLIEGKIRAQSQVIQWINLQLASRKPKAYRRELRIQRPGMKSIRLVVTETGATISAQGLDPDRLAKLLEENLEQLTLQ